MSNDSINASVKKNDGRAKRSAVANAAGTHPTATGYLGDLVAWDIEADDGFSHRRNVVADLFERHGFYDLVVRHRDPGSTLHAAIAGVVKGRGIVVKSIDRKRSDTPACLGVYRKVSNQGEVGDDWHKGARVRVDSTTDLAVALPFEGQQVADPACLAVAEKIAGKANELYRSICNVELSTALCEAGRSVMWAAYRRKLGGVWFVYAAHAQRFRALLDDLEKLGGFYPIVQPVFVDSDQRSAGNVARASEGVLDKALAELEADLTKATAEGMSDAAIERRVAECAELVSRAELYGSLLAEKADDIAAKVAKIRAGFEQQLSTAGDGFFDEVLEALGPAASTRKTAEVFDPFGDDEPSFSIG